MNSVIVFVNDKQFSYLFTNFFQLLQILFVVTDCFSADQTECEHILSSAHKQKHTHNFKFYIRRHDFTCF